MKGIKEKEGELFERWAKNRKGFVSDGIVDEGSYNASNVKLLFVLKEVNEPHGGGWDLREFLRNGGMPQTWDNTTRWVYGIRNLEKEISWSELKTISEDQRKELLRSICVINLKKSPGDHTTNNDELYKIALEDKEFLKEQFALYGPDIIICCGSAVTDILHGLLEFDTEPIWKMTKRGIRYHEFKLNKYLISFSHPEARVQDGLLYYGIIDAMKEIRRDTSPNNRLKD